MGTFRVIEPSVKAEVIDQIRNKGVSVTETARSYEINPRTIYGWLKQGVVDNNKGIYEYLLTDDEKTLNLRAFDEKMKVKQYEQQKGICKKCKRHFEIDEMEADHIVPWHSGGKTVADNCQMLCKQDNRTKQEYKSPC